MSNTGWTYPGSAEDGTPTTYAFDGIHDFTWATPTYIEVSDTNYAVNGAIVSNYDFGHYTNTLRAYNFGFSIPSSATIDGVSARFRANKSDTSGTTAYMNDYVVKLIGTSSTYIGNNKATSTNWTTTLTLYTRGGSSDLWGATLTPTIVNNSNFGVGLEAEVNAGTPGNYSNITGHVDYIQLIVYYTVTIAAPTNCSSIQVGEDVSITWTDNATNEDYYEVQRNINSAGWVSLDSGLAANTEQYTDSTPVNYPAFIEYRTRAGLTGEATSNWATATPIYYRPFTGSGLPVFYYS